MHISCYTLQHVATHCHTLQHTMLDTSTHTSFKKKIAGIPVRFDMHISCHTLQHTATHCNTPYYTLQHTLRIQVFCRYFFCYGYCATLLVKHYLTIFWNSDRIHKLYFPGIPFVMGTVPLHRVRSTGLRYDDFH